MKTKMKNLMKNNNMQPNKIWLITVQLIVLSLFLVLSQLTLAKDRIQYHIQNFDGSTLKVINEQGVVSQSYQYAPFGQQLQYKKPSNLKDPNAFVGGVQDADDLVYLKQRHYNPVLGRFYQPDPVTFIMKGHGQTNRYQYGWNDSYSFSDRFGLDVESVEKFASILNETMNIGWNNSFPSSTTVRENGAQLSLSPFNNYRIKTYLGPETSSGGSLPSYNLTPIFYNYIAQYHIHPYIGNSYQGIGFSGGDVFGLTNLAGSEYKLGFVKFAESGSMRFALEVVDTNLANKFSKLWSFGTLDDYFNYTLFPNAAGVNYSEKSRSGIVDFLRQNQTGLKYYESYDNEKIRFKEIK